MIEWFGENMWALWLSLVFVLLVVETLTLDLIYLMLSAGAVAALTVSLAGGELWLQAVVGSVTALLMLGAVRPVALKHLRKGPDNQLTNVDRFIGLPAVVINEVTEDGGLAQVEGDTWTARTYDRRPIPSGADAVIDAVDGATVYLRAAKNISWDESSPHSPGRRSTGDQGPDHQPKEGENP